MKRKRLMSYVIGAGVAGTILVLPYAGLAFWRNKLPQLYNINIPYFLLPIVWGFWNWLYFRLNRPFINIGVWGGLLGIILGIAGNFYLYAKGVWFDGALIAPFFAMAVYYVLWMIIIDPLNDELNV